MRQVRLIRSCVAPRSRLRHRDVSNTVSSSSSSRRSSVGDIDRNLQYGRQTAPASSTTINTDDDGSSFPQPEFDNTAVIYASKSTAELVRAYLVFGACSLDVLVDNQTKVVLFYAQLFCTNFVVVASIFHLFRFKIWGRPHII